LRAVTDDAKELTMRRMRKAFYGISACDEGHAKRKVWRALGLGIGATSR